MRMLVGSCRQYKDEYVSHWAQHDFRRELGMWHSTHGGFPVFLIPSERRNASPPTILT